MAFHPIPPNWVDREDFSHDVRKYTASSVREARIKNNNYLAEVKKSCPVEKQCSPHARFAVGPQGIFLREILRSQGGRRSERRKKSSEKLRSSDIDGKRERNRQLRDSSRAPTGGLAEQGRPFTSYQEQGTQYDGLC